MGDGPKHSRSRCAAILLYEPARTIEGEGAAGLVSADHPFEVLADPDITPEEEQASEEGDAEPAPEPSLGIHIEPHNQTRLPGQCPGEIYSLEDPVALLTVGATRHG